MDNQILRLQDNSACPSLKGSQRDELLLVDPELLLRKHEGLKTHHDSRSTLVSLI